jgi:hypothetical protein
MEQAAGTQRTLPQSTQDATAYVPKEQLLDRQRVADSSTEPR